MFVSHVNQMRCQTNCKQLSKLYIQKTLPDKCDVNAKWIQAVVPLTP